MQNYLCSLLQSEEVWKITNLRGLQDDTATQLFHFEILMYDDFYKRVFNRTYTHFTVNKYMIPSGYSFELVIRPQTVPVHNPDLIWLSIIQTSKTPGFGVNM